MDQFTHCRDSYNKSTYSNDSDVVPKIICVVFSIDIIKNPKNVLETHFVITLRFLYVLVKEVQIVYRLFLVNYYILHVPRLPSQPASNVGGLVIH